MSASGSKLFRRNRALGYVSNKVPAITRFIKRRKDTLVTTCIGRSFQVWTTSHFRLLHVSDAHPDEITCMATDRHHIYTASDRLIFAWKSGKHVVHTYKGHTNDIHILFPFRDHLLAVDKDNVFKVWDIKEESVYLEVPFPDDFVITAMVHPPTYLNKVVFGSETGSLKLLNIKDNRLIYTFNGRESRVTALEASPAIDVIAVGYHDGAVVLLNLKYDEVLIEFNQDWGPVTGISFRQDGPPIMTTSSSNGHLAFWNLEERKLANQIQAHDDCVTTTHCYPNEPLLLTTSPDNSMKLWIFDMSDGSPRILRIREGHTAPPTCIRYHGLGGKYIVSSGEDSSLRVFCTLSESLHRSMGRASYNRKASKKKNRFEDDPLLMPPIVHFTTETTRDKEWDSIAAIHSGIIQTTTWSFHKHKMGELRLVPEQFQNKHRKDFTAETTCIELTHCGNFVVIGYSSGDLEKFNIQSGIHRTSYGPPAHSAPIRGVAIDNLNQFVVSGDGKGTVHFWNFKESVKEPIQTLSLTSGVSMFRSHRESAMVCIALEDFSVAILDCDTKAIIRKFEGHTARINDATFSPDSRWVVTAAMDSTIKIWDIPSSYMVDHFKVERPCVSLTMSPTGDFLATSHVNHLGVYLWANKKLFSHISLRSINPYSEAPYIDLPSSIAEEKSLETALEDLDMDEGEEVDLNYNSPSQLEDNLITMSGLSVARWQNLLNLDTIKKRNRPIAPPKAPKQAPFFLPTVAGLDFKFDMTDALKEKELEENATKMIMPQNFNNLTTFGKYLEEALQAQEYEKPVAYIKSMGPSMIDFEIKSLHPIGGGSYKALLGFLQMINFMFESCSCFELAQAYLSCFLKAHGRSLVEKKELVESLANIEQVQTKCWKKLEEELFYGLGVVSALRNYV